MLKVNRSLLLNFSYVVNIAFKYKLTCRVKRRIRFKGDMSDLFVSYLSFIKYFNIK